MTGIKASGQEKINNLHVGIICAVPGEFHRAREILSMTEGVIEAPNRIAWKQGRGYRWELLMTGPGHTIPDSWGLKTWDLLIDTGCCGALDSQLPINQGILSFCSKDLDSSEESLISENKKQIISRAFPSYKTRDILTLNEPLIDRRKRDQLYLRTGLSICTMESKLHLHYAQERGITLFSLRRVTDFAEQESLKSFKSTLKEAMTALYGDLRQFLIKNKKELLMIAQ